MAKAASLTSGLLTKKGEAVPAAATHANVKNEGSSPTTIAVEMSKNYFKALTVKLDKDRYMRLKQAGLHIDKSSQEIFVEALDAYLERLNT